MAKEKQIVKTTVTHRNFRYELEGTTLDFTLRNDNVKELVAYARILKQAIIDVEDEIKSIQETKK